MESEIQIPKSEKLEFHDNPRLDSFVDISLAKLRYKIYGPADAKVSVVCVHGIGSFSYCWIFLANILAQAGFKVITLDLPGRGNSIPKDYYTPQNLSYFITVLYLTF
jgi:pimeloyl-ACP methyl ester carboxylesterase